MLTGVGHYNSERFLPTGATFRIGLVSENHRLQLVLVLTVHWWPTPVSVGGLLFKIGLEPMSFGRAQPAEL